MRSLSCHSEFLSAGTLSVSSGLEVVTDAGEQLVLATDGTWRAAETNIDENTEQRDLEKVLVVTDEQGAPGPRPLDLESGTVTIELPVRPRPGSTAGPATVTG